MCYLGRSVYVCAFVCVCVLSCSMACKYPVVQHGMQAPSCPAWRAWHASTQSSSMACMACKHQVVQHGVHGMQAPSRAAWRANTTKLSGMHGMQAPPRFLLMFCNTGVCPVHLEVSCRRGPGREQPESSAPAAGGAFSAAWLCGTYCCGCARR